MPAWREPGRPVRWTKEGKLEYCETTHTDPISKVLCSLLTRLVNQPLIDGFSVDALGEVSRALTLRKEELEK